MYVTHVERLTTLCLQERERERESIYSRGASRSASRAEREREREHLFKRETERTAS